MTQDDALRWGARELRVAGIPDAARDARWLMAEVAAPRIDGPLEADILARFKEMIAARAQHQPVSQIVGWREFYGRRFRVTPDTLDPRPDTETLIEKALAGPRPARFLDLGTGTGCIAVTLLAEWPDATGLATDISPDALAVAATNAEAIGVADRLTLLAHDGVDGLDLAGVDLIVSNPPYIAEAEMAGLSRDVRDWEPRVALTPGGDGLDMYRRLAAATGIAPGTRLIVEIGYRQAEPVRALFVAAGWSSVELERDLGGNPRVISAVLTRQTP